MSVTHYESCNEARFQELRFWISDSLRLVESKHVDLRDNFIDTIELESYRARRILDQWSADSGIPDEDQYAIIGYHEELTWMQKQLDFLRIEPKKKGSKKPESKTQQVFLDDFHPEDKIGKVIE